MNKYTFDQLPLGKNEKLIIEITASDIDQFATLSGDFSTIHLDDDYANGRGFEKRLVHGMLVSSYISAFLGMKLPGKHGLLQSINCQFVNPCYAPNTLQINGIIAKRSEALRVVKIHISVMNKEGLEIVRADANSVLKF